MAMIQVFCICKLSKIESIYKIEDFIFFFIKIVVSNLKNLKTDDKFLIMNLVGYVYEDHLLR